jgi:hypothetical protein
MARVQPRQAAGCPAPTSSGWVRTCSHQRRGGWLRARRSRPHRVVAGEISSSRDRRRREWGEYRPPAQASESGASFAQGQAGPTGLERTGVAAVLGLIGPAYHDGVPKGLQWRMLCLVEFTSSPRHLPPLPRRPLTPCAGGSGITERRPDMEKVSGWAWGA